MNNKLKILGIASGIAAEIRGSELGVWDMFYNITKVAPHLQFDKVFYHSSNASKLAVIDDLVLLFQQLHSYIAQQKNMTTNDKYLFFSGDHANGFGIWSAMANLYQQDMGLIWIDAHLDCHTPSTTPSNNVHGMPVAHLIGEGDVRFTNLIKHKFKPENICYIATRDYEEAEIEFINKHNIKAYFMKDITSDNLDAVVKEAIARVCKNTKKFGISLDIDSLEPTQAPATGCYTPGGLNVEDLSVALYNLVNNEKFCGLEITEYNPLRDDNFKTREVIIKILQSVFNFNKEGKE